MQLANKPCTQLQLMFCVTEGVGYVLCLRLQLLLDILPHSMIIKSSAHVIQHRQQSHGSTHCYIVPNYIIHTVCRTVQVFRAQLYIQTIYVYISVSSFTLPCLYVVRGSYVLYEYSCFCDANQYSPKTQLTCVCVSLVIAIEIILKDYLNGFNIGTLRSESDMRQTDGMSHY